MEKGLFSIIISGDISLIAGKNLRQTIKRDIETQEKIILSSASILEKVTVYEILFIMGLKFSMKRYVESYLEQLYNDGYLQFEEIYDRETLKKNLERIFKEIYESKAENNPPNQDIADNSPSLPSVSNILHFSPQEIQEEINKIRSDTSFLYQYSLSKEGEMALKENKIKFYSEEAIINFALITLNVPYINTEDPSIFNNPNPIISIIINRQNYPMNKQFQPIKKIQYPLISALLKDNENNIMDPTFSIETIELSKTTEFIEQHLKKINIEFSFDNDGNLIRMNLESNDIENWNLNQILQENITYFNENPLFTSEILDLLSISIKNEFRDMTFVINEKDLTLKLQELEDLQYFKKNYPKMYADFDRIQELRINDKTHYLEFKINLRIEFNPEEQALLYLYFADLFYDQLHDKKPISYNEIRNWVSERLINYQKNHLESEIDIENLILAMASVLKTLQIQIIDEKILECCQTTLSNTNLLLSQLQIRKYKEDWRVNIILDENDILAQYSNFDILYNRKSLAYQVQAGYSIKFQFDPLPSSNTDQFLLIAKMLLFQLDPTKIISLSELLDKIYSVIKELQDISLFFGSSIDFSNLMDEFLKENPNDLTLITEKLKQLNVELSIYDWILESIKNELFPPELSDSGIFQDIRFSERNILKNSFTISFAIKSDAINSLIVQNNPIIDSIQDQVYQALIQHTVEFQRQIKDQITFNIILKRFISDKIAASNPKSKQEFLDVFYDLFFLSKKGNSDESTLDSLQEKFKSYLKSYQDIIPKQSNILNPVMNDDEIHNGIIQYCEKYAIITHEKQVLIEVNKKFNSQLKLSNFILSKKDSTDALYLLDEYDFDLLFNQLKEQSFSVNTVRAQKKKFIYLLHFLPKIDNRNIDLTVFPGNYFIQYIIEKMKQENKSDPVFFAEFKESLALGLNELFETYSKFDQSPFWKLESIVEMISSYDSSQLAELGINIEFIDMIVKEKLIDLPFFQKYSWNNLKRIELQVDSNQIYYKISKSELLSLKSVGDFQFITELHEFPIKFDASEHNFQWEFFPLDKNGSIEFSYLRFFFQNNKSYSPEEFLDIKATFSKFLHNDLSTFGIKISEQELRENKIKEWISKLNNKLKEFSET